MQMTCKAQITFLCTVMIGTSDLHVLTTGHPDLIPGILVTFSVLHGLSSTYTLLGKMLNSTPLTSSCQPTMDDYVKPFAPDSDELKACIKSHLTGEAASVVLDADAQTWEEMKAALLLHFRPDGEDRTHMAAL